MLLIVATTFCLQCPRAAHTLHSDQKHPACKKKIAHHEYAGATVKYQTKISEVSNKVRYGGNLFGHFCVNRNLGN